MRRLLPLILLFFIACASTTTPPPVIPVVPDWESVPAAIPAALCQRLQLDGVGSIGTEVAIVKITQPVATGAALATLGKPRRAVQVVHRGIPVATVNEATGCTWRPIDALDPARQHDAMVVELSAPVPNPAARQAAGMVARVSLGGTHPNWYWIELIPLQGAWAVGRILPLSL